MGPPTSCTLIRRATLDLTGLPPTPEEIEAFEKDASPDAFAKVVDRLLASPRYGERGDACGSTSRATAKTTTASLDPMGRGYNPYPNAYLYRDWVIKAFNDDLPYDQFVKAQLAADLLDETARVRHAAGARVPRPRARGTTTTARSRSRAPTSATIASTSSRAASSA